VANEPYDWVDDDTMSAEETMRRFRALKPTRTTGPVKKVQREHIPTPDELIPRSALTYASTTKTTVIQRGAIVIGSTSHAYSLPA
jgi:hypothetical protein